MGKFGKIGLFLANLLPINLIFANVLHNFDNVREQIRIQRSIKTVSSILGHLNNQIDMGLLSNYYYSCVKVMIKINQHGMLRTNSNEHRFRLCQQHTKKVATVLSTTVGPNHLHPYHVERGQTSLGHT